MERLFVITIIILSAIAKTHTSDIVEEDATVYMIVTEQSGNGKEMFEEEESGSGTSGSGSGDDVIDFSTTPVGSASSSSFNTVMRFTTASNGNLTMTTSSQESVTEELNSEETTIPGSATRELDGGEEVIMTTVIQEVEDGTSDSLNDLATTDDESAVTSSPYQPTTAAAQRSPIAVISVPSPVVPVCGSVTISGGKSYGFGSSVISYSWSVTSTGDVTEIENLLEATSDNADFELDGSVLDRVGDVCTFTLTVTDENNLQSSPVRVDIQASDDDTFYVSISTTVNTTAADPTERFQLRSLVTFFDGCDSASDLQFTWSTNSPLVDDGLGYTINSALTVPASTIPAGTTVTFTLQACLVNDITKCSSSSQAVTTYVPAIQAIISGPSTRLVGISSGDIIMDGSQSNDPSGLPGELTYSWSLERLVGDGLTEFVQDPRGNRFEDLVDVTSSSLSFSSDFLSSEETYQCRLTVTKADRSAEQTVIIQTTVTETIDVSMTLNSGSIHSEDILITKCYFTNTTGVMVTWSIATSDGSGTITLNEESLSVPVQYTTTSSGDAISVLTLAPDVLSQGGSYTVQCSVTETTTKEEIGLSSVDVIVFSKPINCQLLVPDYVELTEISFNTVNCATSSVFPPLLYAYYYEADAGGDLRQLTLQSTDTGASAVGPRAIDGSSDVTFVAEVCDQVGSCSYFSTTVSISAVVMVTESDFSSFQQSYVTNVAATGDSLSALQNLNAILETVTSTESMTAVNSSAVAELQVSLLSDALSDADGASDVAMALADQIQGISTADLGSSGRDALADAVTNLLDDVSNSSDPLSSSTLSSILTTTQELHSQGVDNTKISTVEDQVLKMITRNALTGGDPVEITTADATYIVQRSTPCGDFSLSSQSSSSTINLGEEVCNRYSGWSCEDDTVCLGVSIKTVLYEAGVDYVSSSSDASLSSAVMKLDLGNDQTEDNIPITGLSSKISLTLSVTSFSADDAYACRYWDDVTSSWSSEGVETVVNSATGTAECRTSHLSAFVVVVDDGSSASHAPTTVSGDVTQEQNPITTIAQATLPSSFFNNPLYTVIFVGGSLFILFCFTVFIFVCVLYIFQRKNQKSIKASQEMILSEMRARRAGRRSNPSTPRGKVSPEPPQDDNGNTTKMAAVPPAHEMEDPKIAWI